MADNDIEITISTKIDSLTAAVNSANAKIKSLQDAAKHAGKSLDDLDKRGNGMHGTVSSVQAASAALRDLNGDLTHNIRAVERFVTTIPGVGKALQVAFPVLGGLAFGAMLVGLATKISEFYERVNGLPRAIQTGFQGMVLSTETATDELIKRTDETRDHIAVLLGKTPQNEAKIAIDDTRIAADQLAASAATAAKSIADMLKQNRVSVLDSTFSSQGGTDVVEGTANYYLRDLQDKAFAAQQAYHSGNQGEGDRLTGIYQSRRAEAIRNLTADAADRKAHPDQFSGDQAASISIDQGTASALQAEIDKEAATAADKQATEQQKQIENAQRVAEKQKAAAAKSASDRLRKIEEQYQAQQDSAPIFSASKDASLDQAHSNILFLGSHVGDFPAGSGQAEALAKQYDEVIKQAHAIVAKHFADFREDVAKDAAESVKMTDLGNAMSTANAEDALHTGPKYTQYRAEQYKSQAQPDGQANAMTALAIAQQKAAGTISRYDEAQETAALHAKEYSEALAELKFRLADLANQNLSPEQYQTQQKGLQNQIDALSGQNAVQSSMDQAAINDTTLRAAWQTSLNQFVQDSRDTAKQIGSIFSDALSSVNNTLATVLTSHYHTTRERNRALRNGLGDDVRGAGAKLANAGISKVEGSALSAFGFGKKADGSSEASALWVKIAGAMGLGGGSSSGSAPLLSTGGGILSRLFGGGGSSSDAEPGAVADDGSFFGTGGGSTNALGNLLFGGLFQGGFASGGDVVADRPSIIGEKGPEVFVPASAGRIIPNDALGGSSATTHNWNIDARGSSDPAAVEAAVQRGIKRATPTIVALSAASQRNQTRRTVKL